MSQFIEMFGNPVTNTKGWKTAKIKDVAPEMPSKEQLSGKIWLLNLDMIESNTGRIIEKVYEDVENALSVQSFDEGNVLFSKLRPYLNKVVIPDEPGMATTELVPLRPEPSKLHKVFLSHLLRGNQFVNYANDIAGGTKMPRMPLTELRNFDCILPPMDKQLEFVFIAEQVDKSKFGDFKSQFIEMFGTVENNTHNFPIMTIGEFANCFAGATPSTSHPEYWENGRIRWMSSGEVHKGHVEDTDSRITELGYKSASTRMVPIHSIVIAIAGQGKTRGTVAITEVDLCTNQSLCAIVPDERVNYSYLYHNLQGRYLELRGLSGDVNGRGGLNLKIIQKIPVILPPIEKQQQFASIAQQADKSKSVIQKALVYLNDIQSDELRKIA